MRTNRAFLVTLVLVMGGFLLSAVPFVIASTRPTTPPEPIVQLTPDRRQAPAPVVDAPLAPANPLNYPQDPTSDIPWSAGYSGVSDVQAAFNQARNQENQQLGTSIPPLTMPTQAEWDAKTDGEKALWLINRERVDRGVHPLHGLESNVTGVAQGYAEYLIDNDAFGHSYDVDGDGVVEDPWDRLHDDTDIAPPAIVSCHDFLGIAENLAVLWTSRSSVPLPIEQSIYMWMYTDQNCSWGHRHAILWSSYNDNGGPAGREGFLGIGRDGGPHDGWTHGEIVVMNVFDPCASWDYADQAPVAGFTGSPTSGPKALTASFSNTSNGDYDDSLWTLGDGTTETVENPTHTYTTPGLYTVTLTVDGPAGADTITRSRYVTVCHAADVVCDCITDITDIQAMADHWRCEPGGGYEAKYDIDADDDIDVVDIMLLATRWGCACGDACYVGP